MSDLASIDGVEKAHQPVPFLVPVLRAHDRLRALRLKSREAHAVIPGFNDRAEVNGERGDAERRLQQLLAPRSQNGFQLDPTDARVVEQEKLVQKCSDEAFGPSIGCA